MKRYLLDTGIAGLFINDRKGIRERAKSEAARGHVVGICLPVLAELQFGAKNSKNPDQSLKRFHRALPLLRVWPMTFQSAAEYGRISTEMKRLGINIGQIDRLIAGIAVSLPDCTVVSADTDMSKAPGLPVENWLLTKSNQTDSP